MIERLYSGAEKPLRKALPELFPEVPFSEICALIRRRDVKVDGRRITADTHLLKCNSSVIIYPQKTKTIKILFEDDNLLACYKPKGIASEGSPSFEEVVRNEKGNVRLMHRLDTNTDGVLLFSKNEKAYKELFEGMKSGRITKYYDAEVYGVPPSHEPTELKFYYKKDAEKGRALISRQSQKGYLPVSLRFEVVKVTEHGALLSVELHKGKMHQIRAMLAAYGFFILGDGKYGSDEINRALGITKTRLTARSIRFSFPEDSFLSYLNTITISI